MILGRIVIYACLGTSPVTGCGIIIIVNLNVVTTTCTCRFTIFCASFIIKCLDYCVLSGGFCESGLRFIILDFSRHKIS